MKAAFLTGKQQFELREIPAPLPAEDGLVLQVKACGVCGSDLRRWKEGLPPGGDPVIPGHEISGVVTAVGGRVTGYAPGDLLAVAPDVHCGRCYYCQRGLYNLCDDLHFLGITSGYPGGFAEQMALSGEILANGILHRMPQGMDFAYAALAEPCSSVLACHEKINTQLGDSVLVMGGGPIGVLHIAVAQARGARVILSEPSPVRRAMAQPFHPAAIIDPSQENVAQRIQQLTAGLGVDAVICANPVAATHTQAVEVVRKGGKVVLFGGLPKASPMTALDANRIHYGEVDVVGSFSYHPSFHEMALQVIQQGRIPAGQVITHTFPLEEIAAAFHAAAGGEALKVMVSACSRF
jgi:L-iditol 2-dehydrogenase